MAMIAEPQVWFPAARSSFVLFVGAPASKSVWCSQVFPPLPPSRRAAMCGLRRSLVRHGPRPHFHLPRLRELRVSAPPPRLWPGGVHVLLWWHSALAALAAPTGLWEGREIPACVRSAQAHGAIYAGLASLLLLCLSVALAAALCCIFEASKKERQVPIGLLLATPPRRPRVDTGVGNYSDLSAGQYFVLCDKDREPVRSSFGAALGTDCSCKDMFVGRAILGVAGMLPGAEPCAASAGHPHESEVSSVLLVWPKGCSPQH